MNERLVDVDLDQVRFGRSRFLAGAGALLLLTAVRLTGGDRAAAFYPCTGTDCTCCSGSSCCTSGCMDKNCVCDECSHCWWMCANGVEYQCCDYDSPNGECVCTWQTPISC